MAPAASAAAAPPAPTPRIRRWAQWKPRTTRRSTAPNATFDGQAIDTTAVLIKYTYYGDADFNGKVNFDDYVRTDSGFNNHKTGWTNGDFDGNGSVNFDDYVLVDLAFNTQGGTL
jgi:hypothetical protein